MEKGTGRRGGSLEIFTRPGTKGGGGGLNLVLAFNGVCKLYLGGGKGWKEWGGVERVVKIDVDGRKREEEVDGKKKWEEERKGHSWRLPHKLPKKALLRVSVRVWSSISGPWRGSFPWERDKFRNLSG